MPSFWDSLSDENLAKNQTPLALTLAFILILVSFPIVFYLAQKRVPFLPQAAVTAELAFCPSSYQLCPSQTPPTPKVGDPPFDVQIFLNPGANNVVDAVDVVIEYDSAKLEVQDADGQTPGTQISPGTMFATYLRNNVSPCGSSNSARRGKITLSGIAYDPNLLPAPPPHNPVKNPGVFATISFKPIAQGSANVSFDFTSSVTTESNVVEGGTATDILASVTNLNFNISSGQVLPTPTTCPPPPTATPTLTPSPTPVGGPCTQPDWDLDCDGLVCGRDASVLVSNWGKAPAYSCPKERPNCNPDFNGDKMIDGKDASVLMAHWSVGKCP
ncbi:MAG: hypothetical protein FJ044_03105 [Candidatus Cloacimonetes bacterium]|nr:hypothetical protein [Candidatus Cloacimonadota bacterium]